MLLEEVFSVEISRGTWRFTVQSIKHLDMTIESLSVASGPDIYYTYECITIHFPVFKLFMLDLTKARCSCVRVYLLRVSTTSD